MPKPTKIALKTLRSLLTSLKARPTPDAFATPALKHYLRGYREGRKHAFDQVWEEVGEAMVEEE